MKYMLILTLLIAVPCWGQTTTGTADTKGPCSPAVTGNNNQFTINCQGITKEQGAEFLKILNKISRDQLDPKAVMTKLDEIEKEVEGVAKSIPRSRVMSDENFNAFADALKKATGTIRVVPAGSTDDIQPLAQQICNAAVRANWAYSCPMGRNSVSPGEPEAAGLLCYSEDWSAPDALAFKNAMAAAGLTCRYFPHAYDFRGIVILGTSGVTILIGRPER